MSILNKIFGNAVEGNKHEMQKEFANILVENEEVVAGYKLLRDSIIFTTERLLLIDVQGITGSKVKYTYVPYSSVKMYSMETAGTFDYDSEIKLYIQSIPTPIDLKFKKNTDLNPIYKVLSKYILRDN